MHTFETLPIRAWAELDRPREKLMEKGRHLLSDAELIGILIGSGSQKESAVDLSKRILNSVGNDLYSLGKLNINDLIKFNGIGEAKAISIIAALELGRRRKAQEIAKRTKLTTSRAAFEYIFTEFEDLTHEEFWIILLDRSNQVIRKQNISKGGLSGTVVDIRIIFKAALDHLASGLLLFHNHPSGNLKASEEDLRITKQIKEASKLIDINLLDHIIIAGKEFYSFADNGVI